jgi:O-Antigen ligase/Tetratricopeptide repeat
VPTIEHCAPCGPAMTAKRRAPTQRPGSKRSPGRSVGGGSSPARRAAGPISTQSRRPARRRNWTRLGVLAAVLAFANSMLVIQPLLFPVWSPRYALLPVEAAVGIPLLIGLVRSDAGVGARWALAFSGWAIVSMVLSGHPAQSFWGWWGQGTGVLFILAFVGCWALGTSVETDSALLLERTLIVAVLLNVALAFLQTAVRLDSLGLALFDGRATGAWGNPVFLAGFLGGGLWLGIPRLPSQPWLWGGYAAAVTAGIELSGSRFALVLLAVALLGAVRLIHLRLTLLLALCMAGGLLLGTGAASLGGLNGATSRVTQSFGASSDPGLRPRLEMWRWGARAVARRPVVGAGPSRFQSATSKYETVAFARTAGRDETTIDAHNIVVEYAVTVGLPGVLLLLVWLWSVFRRAGWGTPLAGFGLLALGMHLVEPQSVGLTPLALLALGAAAPLPRLPRPVVPGWAHAALVTGAAVACVSIVIGSADFGSGVTDVNPSEVQAARPYLPRWNPELLFQVGYMISQRSHDLPAARVWVLRAVQQQPDNPIYWLFLAQADQATNKPDRAIAEYRQALVHDPQAQDSLNGLGQLLLQKGQRAEAAALLRHSLSVQPGQAKVVGLLQQTSPSP